MFSREITIKNPTGLHARPASQLTALCKKFPNEIMLQIGEHEVDPKSIISVLTAGIKCGSVIKVNVDGENAQAVVEELTAFLEGLVE